MPIKYVTSDGTAYDTEQAALDHENLEDQRDSVRAEVENFLAMKGKTVKAAAVARNHIMEWIEYDLRQRPERYQIPVPPPVAVVSEAG